jgi:phage tail tape-measure protein
MQKTLISSLLVLSLISCSTNTGTGALVGGGGGALIGGLAGGWEGAAIGGAAGAILGGLIGNAADQKQKQQQIDNDYPGLSQKLINNEPLNVQDVINLSKQNVPPEQIIRYLKESDSQFTLTKQDCKTLCRKGVADSVVKYMSNGACGCN